MICVEGRRRGFLTAMGKRCIVLYRKERRNPLGDPPSILARLALLGAVLLSSPFLYAEEAPETTSRTPSTAPALISTQVVPLGERRLYLKEDSLLLHLGASLGPLFSYSLREEAGDLAGTLGFSRAPNRSGEGWELRLGLNLNETGWVYLHYLTSSRSLEEVRVSGELRRLTASSQLLMLGGERLYPLGRRGFFFAGVALGGGSLRYTYFQERFGAVPRVYNDYLKALSTLTASPRFSQTLEGTGVSAGLHAGIGVKIRSALKLFLKLTLTGGYYPGGSFQDEDTGMGIEAAPPRYPLLLGGTIGFLLLEEGLFPP